MAIKVKSATESANKWGDRAAGAADIYSKEAEAAAAIWAANTAAASENFRKAITVAGIAARFAAGVKKAGADKFARKIRDVARDRYAPGIHAAKGDYQGNVEPYLATIAGLTLSPRAPRGDPANLGRVGEVAKALNAKRLAMLGMGS